MYQLAKRASLNEKDATKFTLFYANKSEADILIKDELDGLEKSEVERAIAEAAKRGEMLKVWGAGGDGGEAADGEEKPVVRYEQMGRFVVRG
jgi:hypothetical protein